jgi:hypothetical protein
LFTPYPLFFRTLPAAKSRTEKRDPPLFSFSVSLLPYLDAYDGHRCARFLFAWPRAAGFDGHCNFAPPACVHSDSTDQALGSLRLMVESQR